MEKETLYKAKQNKKEANPMKDSEYCYYQAFGEALMGFAKALEYRRGRVYMVTTDDILDYANIDPKEFDFLFKSPDGLIKCVKEEMTLIFSDAGKMLVGMKPEAMLTAVLKRLQKNSPMLTVLLAINDHAMWRPLLKHLLIHLETKWPTFKPEEWDYLYQNFCCQFALIMERWELTGFSAERIDDCVRLICVWLEADNMLFDTVERISEVWRE